MKRFESSPIGDLTPISGTDATGRSYEGHAYVPHPLGGVPDLSGRTWSTVGDAMHALGRLAQASTLLPNPAILARPTLRREAESTSALEGTFAPLEDIVAGDAALDGFAASDDVAEVLNYLRASDQCMEELASGRRLTVGLLSSLHATLVEGTRADTADAGRVRTIQVVVGARGRGFDDARFVPPPPGVALDALLRDLLDWMQAEQPGLSPVVSAAMSHYQFETIHPFNDGNGRLGRLLIVAHLLARGAVATPVLSVSPWFERRRAAYQEGLARVSETGEWDPWVAFFAEGIEASAQDTARRFEDMLALEKDFLDRIRSLGRRGAIEQVPGLLIGQPVVTVSWLSKELGVSYQAASNLVQPLVELGILAPIGGTYPQRFRAPEALRVIA
ncbi:Adenosine monophosphate-protein transferase SoFic [Pseudoclavibacter triregionum]|nr:Adenosine monophosphate-protein transferase SoFic [Pseudoclavibacter triregionum]